MITVELLGIDSYLAQDLCKDVHEGLANMYETKAEDILFFAPESFLIYKGLEQTSYRLNIVVEAPNKYPCIFPIELLFNELPINNPIENTNNPQIIYLTTSLLKPFIKISYYLIIFYNFFLFLTIVSFKLI